MRPRDLILMFACVAVACILPLQAQQKGQWVPGQMGLNAGVTPDPGFTYSNMAINYSAGKLNDSNGNAVQGITGTYAFWVDENVFAYVPKFKILGAKFVPMAIVSFANGSLVAELSVTPGTNLSPVAGGSGIADTFIQPVGLSWSWKRADVNVRICFRHSERPLHRGSQQQRGLGILGQRFNNWHHGLPHQEQGDQRQSVHRLGGSRTKDGREHALRAVQQNHSRSGLHHGVGAWADSSVEERSQQASPTGSGWIRPVAGFGQWWQLPGGWNSCGCEPSALFTQCMVLGFSRLSFCRRRTWRCSSSTTTNIQPKLVRWDARSYSAVRGH